MSIKRMIKILLIAVIAFMPINAIAGGGSDQADLVVTTDTGTNQLVSYYDLRNRESFVQVSNTSTSAANIHVQIFRNDFANCQEIDFYDTLTPNDTHIYNMSDLQGNALPVNVNLADDSNGIVVITLVTAPQSGSPAIAGTSLIGNFRIVDASGYEYRTNSAGIFDTDDPESRAIVRYTLNFNQIGGNNLSDVIGIEVENAGPGFASTSVSDLDGFGFVYNNAEIPTSCDEFDFFCGDGVDGSTDFLNIGINDAFPSTNGNQSICAGNLDTEGFVELLVDEFFEDDEVAVGFVGLNNGNGTGSMDSWIGNNIDICEFLQDDFGGNCEIDN